MKNKSLTKDFIWNVLGSGMYALSSVLLAFAAMRILGSEEGGIFSFGFSTFGQQMFIIAYFGIRPFHITDVKGEYSYREYEKARILTVLTAVLFSAVYLGFLLYLGTYTIEKAAVLILLALYKIFDGFCDLYESECQRKGCLYRGARELFFRTLSASGVLLLLLVLTKNTLLAAAASLLVQALWAVIFRIRLSGDGVLGDLPKGKGKSSGGVRLLLRSTVLLFLGVFLDFYIFSSSKYAIDLKLTDSDSGIFNLLFMPTNLIYLAANFVIKPYLTPLADAFQAGDDAAFSRMQKKLLVFVSVFAAVCVLFAAVLGRPVLGLFEILVKSTEAGALTSRTGEFVLIIFGGGLYAVANLYYYILVTKRRQKRIFLVYLLAAVAALVLSTLLTGAYGFTGASASYAALMSLLVFGFALSAG